MLVAFLAFSLSFVAYLLPSDAGAAVLLYNPGPTRRCHMHVEGVAPATWSTPGYFDEASECHLDGNPANMCPTWIATDGSCPSRYVVTWNWSQSSLGVYPGWDVWVIGGWGEPIELVAQSNAKPFTQLPDSCTLREVSPIHYAWPDASLQRQANLEPYKITSFNRVWWSFDAKLKHYNGPPNRASTPTAIVTADAIVAFPTETVYAIGVIIFNGNSFDMNGNPGDDVFYTNWDPATDTCDGIDKDEPIGVVCQTLLHGDRLGHPVLNSSSFQSYSINVRPLFVGEAYLPAPPAGFTWSDAEIRSVEVYPSVRGADLGVHVSNAALWGSSGGCGLGFELALVLPLLGRRFRK